MVKRYIKENYPTYYNDRSKIIYGDNKSAKTKLNGTIVLPKKYRDNPLITDSEYANLTMSLVHEYQHANDLEDFNLFEKIIYNIDMYYFQNGPDPGKGIWENRHYEIYHNAAVVSAESEGDINEKCYE